MNRSSITFVMPAYHCASTIGESVESIYEGNFSDGDELIIVDDGSTDETPAAIEALQKKFPEIRSFRHRLNKGSAAAGRNTAIDASRNELIFCLDADNLLYPGTVPRLREHLYSTGADVACFGELSFFTGDEKQITHYWVFPEEVRLADALAGNIHPCGSGNYLYSRASWKRAGRYNESLGGAYDSWGFGVMQLATGSRMVTLPGTSYLHRHGYESTFVRESGKRNPSLLALQVLLPVLDQIDERDQAYLFSRSGRCRWIERLSERPIRTRTGEPGRPGILLDSRRQRVVSTPKSSMCRRALGKLARAILPSP